MTTSVIMMPSRDLKREPSIHMDAADAWGKWEEPQKTEVTSTSTLRTYPMGDSDSSFKSSTNRSRSHNPARDPHDWLESSAFSWGKWMDEEEEQELLKNIKRRDVLTHSPRRVAKGPKKIHSMPVELRMKQSDTPQQQQQHHPEETLEAINRIFDSLNTESEDASRGHHSSRRHHRRRNNRGGIEKSSKMSRSFSDFDAARRAMRYSPSASPARHFGSVDDDVKPKPSKRSVPVIRARGRSRIRLRPFEPPPFTPITSTASEDVSVGAPSLEAPSVMPPPPTDANADVSPSSPAKTQKEEEKEEEEEEPSRDAEEEVVEEDEPLRTEPETTEAPPPPPQAQVTERQPQIRKKGSKSKKVTIPQLFIPEKQESMKVLMVEFEKVVSRRK